MIPGKIHNQLNLDEFGDTSPWSNFWDPTENSSAVINGNQGPPEYPHHGKNQN